MHKVALLALVLTSCTGLGEVTEEATGIDWEWTWQLRIVCPDQSRVVVDEGTTCTGDADAFAADKRSGSIVDEGWCGEPVLRSELSMDPVTFGPC